MDKILEVVRGWFEEKGYGQLFDIIKGIAEFIATL